MGVPAGAILIGGGGDYVTGGGAGLSSFGGNGGYYASGGAGIYAKGGAHGAWAINGQENGKLRAPAAYLDGDTIVTGIVTAAGFSGPLTGTISAANVSNGQFGSNTAGGVYSFPDKVGIGTAIPSLKLTIQDGGILIRESGSVHGMTGYFSQNTTGIFNTMSSTNGGARIYGVSSANADSLEIRGVVGSETMSSWVGAVKFRAYKQSGTSIGALGDGDLAYQFTNSNTNLVSILGSGNVGIGTTDPGLFKLKVVGNAAITGTLQTMTGSDFAEEFTVSYPIEAGTVVVMGDLGYKSVKACSQKYDTTVVGIVSDDPSIIAGKVDSKHKAVVAMMGVVKVKVTDVNGKIKKGTLLTTSSIPGYAMKSSDYTPGTMIGKALEDLSGSRGEIKVLVNLQ